MMTKKTILDRYMHKTGYDSFAICKILDCGRSIRFQMRNGTNYDVPIDYFLKWYNNPHYVRVNGRWKEFKRAKVKNRVVKNLRFSRLRRLPGNYYILLVYLKIGRAHV